MLASLVQVARSLPSRLGRVETRAYIPELDGLRCLAIMFVLVWHSALRAARYIDHANKTAGLYLQDYYGFFPHGEVGVMLFFFVSGFVVSQPFLLRPRSEWKVAQFYQRRVVRIYPPYVIAITLCFLVLGVVGHAPTDANAFEQSSVPLNQSFLASLFYLHGIIFNAPPRLNPPMWSLEIEVLFYAVLPLLMVPYCRGTRRLVRITALGIIVALAITTSSLLFASLDVDLRLRWGLFYHAYLFLVGVMAADLMGDPTAFRARASLAGDALFALGLAVLLVIGFAMTQNDARMTGSVYAFALQSCTVLSLALIGYGAFNSRIASALLHLSWVRLVGTMCYSLYLTHIVVMTAAGEVLGRYLHLNQTWLIYVTYLGVLIPASLVAGTIFYVCVERPFARRLVKPRVTSPDAPRRLQSAVSGSSRVTP